MPLPPAAEKPPNRTLLHAVARMHYAEDLPQIEIARRLDLSAATVSRLLKRAREEGIVRIEVHAPDTTEDLARALQAGLGLKRAGVVAAPEATALAALAGPVGMLLKEAAPPPGSILALGWGRAVRAVINAGLPPVPGLVTVPMTGGMQAAAAHFQINEFVRMAAEQTGGAPRFIHAPSLPSAESRAAFLTDPTIREHVALWDRIDLALVGIGLPHRIDPVHAAAATSGEVALAHAAGDVLRHYFDAQGKLIPWEGDERLIAVSVAQIRQIPLVIGLAAAAAKAGAIVGAVRAGLINALVTDAGTAEAILIKLETDDLSRQ